MFAPLTNDGVLGSCLSPVSLIGIRFTIVRSTQLTICLPQNVTPLSNDGISSYFQFAWLCLVSRLSSEFDWVPGLSGMVFRYLSNSSLNKSMWVLLGCTVSSSSLNSGGSELNNLGPIQKKLCRPFFLSFRGFQVNF